MWDFIECKLNILYHVGYEFEPEQGDLVIIDEADTFMFENPCKFQQFIAKIPCICFTATTAMSSTEK